MWQHLSVVSVLQSVFQAHYSTGAVAHSFTSTATAPVTENEAAVIDRDSLRYAKVKKKGELELLL